MSKNILFVLIFCTCFDLVFAQKFTDSTYVKLTNQKIVINGIDDESDWDKAESRSNFWQWFPTDTIKALKQTEIKFLYDSNNIYAFVKSLKVSNVKRKKSENLPMSLLRLEIILSFLLS